MSTDLMAQNWALLNPAYKYNYSLGGTDTITNQIFVTHIDTLGVDSFRYELNKIGVVCDTCPASMGGPCDGCFVRVNQPQFLGFDCIQSESSWHFNGTDTFMIKSPAIVGTNWMFDQNSGVTAIVDAEWAADLFGVPDTLQRILLSDGDSLVLSRSFGIVLFERLGQHYDLIGVEGPDVGRCSPDLLDYFNFQVGDELTYEIVSTYWVEPNGGFGYPQARSHYWMARITGRTETDSSIHYTTSTSQTFDNVPANGSLAVPAYWAMPNNIWSFDQETILIEHSILGAYPGQLIAGSICWGEWGNDLGYLVKSTISSDGRAVVQSDPPLTGIALNDEVVPGIFPLLPDFVDLVHVQYEEGIGLREVKYRQSSAYEVSVELVGAILAGDTVIQPPSISWAVGVVERPTIDWDIAPNPARESVTIRGAHTDRGLIIQTLQGQLVLTDHITSPINIIDVHNLAPGTYIVIVEGLTPQRLVIAR